MGIIFVISKPSPDCDPLQDRRYRLYENAVHLWEGRDVFSLFSDHPYGFFQITDETPEIMLFMLDDMPMLFHRNKRDEHKLSPRNRVLLYLLWLRTYPSYHMLSVIFMFLLKQSKIKKMHDSYISQFICFYGNLAVYSGMTKYPK